jgi:hypothetical protein
VTSIRERLRRSIAGRDSLPQETVGLTVPRPSDYAYTLYWAGLVRGWEAGRRAGIASAVEAIITEPDFRPNEFYRVYTVPGLDDSAHAGASLLALQKILAFYNRPEGQGELDDRV